MATVVHVEGDHLVGPDGKPLVLRGVSFGNRVWEDDRLPLSHHDQRDFARVAAMGMNAVRFFMTYRTFESDQAPGQWLSDGWKWLDDNVKWAKDNGVYLMPTLHVPPGGNSATEGPRTLWQDPKMQTRMVALWRAIAKRYAGEPAIAGFALLNEPIVDHGIEQWSDLANRIIAAIREVDLSRAIFVERVSAVAGDWGQGRDFNFYRVRDPNAVYEFKFFKPFQFTHQGAPWVSFVSKTARYPDETIAEVEWFHLRIKASTFGSPQVPVGNSDWKFYEGHPFTVTDPSLVVGKPALVTAQVGGGRCFFDDIVLQRLDGEGNPVEDVWRRNLDTPRGWYFWKKSGGGELAVSTQGHGDQAALSVSGTSDDANVGGDALLFRPVPGETYRLSGWMKGELVPRDALCQLRIDFSRSDVPVHARDRAYLEQELDAYVGWAKRAHVPLYLSGFGTIKGSFEDDRGGLRWVGDMLDLLLERNVSFSYHDYHDPSMGLYFGAGTLPEPRDSNGPLIDLFQAKLKPGDRTN